MVDLVIFGRLVTWGINILIGIFAFYGLYHRVRLKTHDSDFVNGIPGLLITLGILGTFAGILISLQGFDVNNISGSIPSILEGLKTAFGTSVMGMTSSLLVKAIYNFLDDKTHRESISHTDDPIEILNNILVQLDGISTSSEAIQSTIVKCFRSEDESSMVSQMKLIRTDMSDMKRELKDAMVLFSEKVSKLATEGIMDALRKVLEQFNTMLGEVVGKAFDDLSLSVIKLVEWQDNYRSEMHRMQVQLAGVLTKTETAVAVIERTGISLERVDSSIGKIGDSVGSITLSVRDIEDNIRQLELQNVHMENMITSIRDIGSEAKNVLPEISNNVKEMTVEFKAAQEKLVIELDEFSKALENSMNSLVGSFSAISGRFAEDYKPLADKLREVVRIAEGVR